MKGISEILAVILIVIIVVALIGLTYTFAANLFTTTTTSTTTSTTAVTGNMQKTVDIVAASCWNSTNVNGNPGYFILNFTLRDTGQQPISSQMTAFLDGLDISNNSIVPGSSPVISVTNDTLNPSQIRGYGYTTTSRGSSTRSLMITTPSGSVTTTVSNCPT